MDKPITIVRQEYIDQIVGITNASELPAFVKVEVLTSALNELRRLINEEFQRDRELWQAAQQTNQEAMTNAHDDI